VIFQRNHEGYSVGAEEALIHFSQAIQINPNYSTVYNWMGQVLDNDLGRYVEGFAAREKAVRLDPLSAPSISNYVYGLIIRNRLDEADRELEKLASIHPVFHASMRGLLASLGGKWANGVLGILDAWRISPDVATDELSLQFAIIGLAEEALAVSEEPLPDVLGFLGRPGDEATTAEARLAETPLSRSSRFALGLALASAGDYVRARPILEEMWQRSGGLVTCCGLSSFTHRSAAALIASREAAGEKAKVDELLAAMRDDVRRYREAGMIRTTVSFSADFSEGLAAYLAGEREKGLVLITKGVEGGYFIPPNQAYLQALYDDPGFGSIRAGQEARQKRERERFLTIVCNDNPSATVWQPEEGTCERFAATGGN